jgi:hypothetical protein
MWQGSGFVSCGGAASLVGLEPFLENILQNGFSCRCKVDKKGEMFIIPFFNFLLFCFLLSF